MNYLSSIFLLLVFILLGGCDKTDTLEVTPVTDYDAFYAGYGGGWGIDIWYRVTEETVDQYYYWVGDTIPEGGYTNPANWSTVTEPSLVDLLRELETDFPIEAFAEIATDFCPEVAFDGICMRVGYGGMTPDDATIWFGNNTDNQVASDYLGRVSGVIQR